MFSYAGEGKSRKNILKGKYVEQIGLLIVKLTGVMYHVDWVHIHCMHRKWRH